MRYLPQTLMLAGFGRGVSVSSAERKIMRDADLPTLNVPGRDLLTVQAWRRAVCLTTPFLLTVAFFVFGACHLWIGSIVCTVLLTFLTYGSISHDLVHGTLRLPRAVNESLLCIIEVISFRSGHAYRVVHLNHHAHFPATDDLEGAAAGMTWWRALLDGVTLQMRLWVFEFRHGRDRTWIIGEGIAGVSLLVLSLVAIPWTIAPAIYAVLMILGSWLFPFITSFIPHDPKGATEITRTRLFRCRVLSVVAFEHSYHLEHHLYPLVPQHNWRELARRLDPHFARAGLRPLRLWF
jgi:beta-carotene hydroxylase